MVELLIWGGFVAIGGTGIAAIQQGLGDAVKAITR